MTSDLAAQAPNHLIFKEWQGENFRTVNQFYRRQKHKGSARGDERVFMIEDDEQIIAAVRLVPYDGFYWLRSLYVEQSRQGHRLGSQLLAFVHSNTQLPIYCFPYLHLDHFYQQAGYDFIYEDEMPQSIHQLYTRYNRKGPGILAMAKFSDK
jgi:N-acetylglutamate synthase-like GNAT family acetyltransferase